MTLSGTTWLLIGIGQFTFVFALSTLFLFLYSKRLKKRTQALTERIDAQSQLHRKTIHTLKEKLGQQQAAPAVTQEPTVEVPGGEFSGLLGRHIQETEERLVALGAEPNAEFQPDDSAEIIAARMRHAFLESEKLVLAFSTDPALMWETLQPNIDKITIGLRRHHAALMAHDAPAASNSGKDQATETEDNAALQEKLSLLEQRWQALTTEAERCVDVLDERYNTLTLALAHQTSDSALHQHTDALANHFLHILNQITEGRHPHKDYTELLPQTPPDSDTDASAEAPAEEDPFSDIPNMELDADAETDSALTQADVGATEAGATEADADAPAPGEHEVPEYEPVDQALDDHAPEHATEIEPEALAQPRQAHDANASEDGSSADLQENDLSWEDLDDNTPELDVDTLVSSSTPPETTPKTTPDSNSPPMESALPEESTVEEAIPGEATSEAATSDEAKPEASVPLAPELPQTQEAEIDALADALAEPALPADATPPAGNDAAEADALADITAHANAAPETPLQDLTDDVDAIMAEADALLADDTDPSDSDRQASDPQHAALFAESTITASQQSALDEEFEALTRDPIIEDDDDPVDPLASLDDDETDDEQDDALDAHTVETDPATHATPTEPTPPNESTAAAEQPLGDVDAAFVDDTLDPDEIIAAALAETETNDSLDDDNALDEATFEDLLADSGVDLHGDLNEKKA